MYCYSKTTNAFYLAESEGNYKAAGLWPDDAVEVDDDDFHTYTAEPPEGMVRGGDSNGYPSWVYLIPPSNAEMLHMTLSILSRDYKTDTFDLNMAYVAAMANDGPSKATKVAAVRSEISARKVKYMSDIAAAKAQYPVE